MNEVKEIKTRPAPVATPQALAFAGKNLWLSSRDDGLFCRLEPENWKVEEEVTPPGIVWAATTLGDGLRVTIGEGHEDDRFIYRYGGNEGFVKLFPCPDLTGSYLSSDGSSLYLSQWYRHCILRLNAEGRVPQTLEMGEEICGHTFVEGHLYLLCGTEQAGEKWKIAEFDFKSGEVRDLALVPFACRSLAFDGERFWSNHRAADECVSFSLPVRP